MKRTNKSTKSGFPFLALIAILLLLPITVISVAAANIDWKLKTDYNISADGQGITWTVDANQTGFSGSVSGQQYIAQTTNCDGSIKEQGQPALSKSGSLTLTFPESGTFTCSYTYQLTGGRNSENVSYFNVYRNGSSEPIVSGSQPGGVGGINAGKQVTGELSVSVGAGDTIQFEIVGSAGPSDTSYATEVGSATLTISGCTFASATNYVTITVAPIENGTITANDTTISKETIFENINSNDGLRISATPNEKYHLVKWCYVDTNGEMGIIRVTDGVVKPNVDCTIFPVLVYDENGVAPFRIGNGDSATYYWTWETAFSAAGTGATVILNDNYTLPYALDANNALNTNVLAENGIPGNAATTDYTSQYVVYKAPKDNAPASITYIMPSGSSFLIPRVDNDTGTLEYAGDYNNSLNLEAPTPYVSLDISNGTTMQVWGVLTNNAYILASGPYDQGYNGVVSGKYGRINVNRGGMITLENGSEWHARGYTQGDGQVTAKSGSTVRHMFQIMDWIGGDNAVESIFNGTLLYKPEQNATRAFPINNFYMFSILCPVTYQYGCTVTAKILLAVPTLSEVQQDEKIIIGTEKALFTISGSNSEIHTYYDNVNKKFVYDILGNISLNSVAVRANAVVVDLSIDSKYSFLPFNGIYAVNIKSGTFTVTNNVKLLPGVTVTVSDGATLKISDGKTLCLYRGSQYSQSYNKSNSHYCRLPVADVFGTNTDTQTDCGVNLANYDAEIISYGSIVGNVAVSSDNYNIYKVDQVTASLSGIGSLVSLSWASNGAGSLTGTAKRPVIHLINNGSYTPGSGTAQVQVYEYPDISGVGRGVLFDPIAYSGASTQAVHKTVRTVTATCTEAGHVVHVCEVDGCDFSATAEAVSALGHTEVIDEALAPTCTAVGKTEGKHCSVCTEVTVAQEEIPATGIHTDTQAHGDEGYMECDGCGKKLFKLVSMNANADARTELVLKFEVHSDLASEECVTVAFDSKGDTEAKPEIVIEETESGNFVYVTQPVASALMTEDVTVSFSNSDETVYLAGSADTSVSRSIVDYARAVLKSSSTTKEAKDLVTYLVTYGGYAQLYFAGQEGYEDVPTDYLAYNVLEELRIPIPSLDDIQIDHNLADAEEVNYFTVAQNAYLGAAIKQDVFFVMQDGYTISGEITLTYKDKVGGDYKQRKLTPVYDSAKKEYCLTILNIPAAFLDYDYTLTGTVVHTDGTSADFSVTPSITAYLGRILAAYNARNIPEATGELVNLAKAMYRYNQAANVFFNDTDATVVAEMEVTE